MLASIGVLSAAEGGTYQLTPLGETLRTDHPNSVRDWALYVGASAPWNAWGHLYESVKTGTPGFVLAHGIPTYDFLESHPELAACFNRWMSKQSAQQNSAIVDAYDFSKFQVVADIGGGQGSTLAAVLERYPSLRGILFDRFPSWPSRQLWTPAGSARAVLLWAGTCWRRCPRMLIST
jgi:hypothetical protein